MRTFRVLIFSLAALISFASGSAPPVFAQEKVVRIALKASDIRSLDPHYGTTTIDYACIDPMFNALVRFKPEDVNPEKIEPDLAEKWERSKDGLVWTFSLRKGVKFHKGYGELTAEDVKFSLEKAANKTSSGFAADYAALDKVEVLDRYKVRITFKSAVPSVLGILTNYHGGYVVSKKAVLEKGEKFKFDPIGTGPFMLKEYIPKEKVVETRHPEFFRGRPKLDRLELWFMPDASSREMAFRKGEIDIVEGEREQAWVNKMRAIPGTAIEIFGPGETLTLHFNMTKKPLDDIRVRRAIAHSIDRDELMRFLGPDVTSKLASVVPIDYLGGADKVPAYEFNPEKGKKLLAEAGYPKGINLSMVITEMSDYRRPMEQVQEQLRRIGIRLKMDVITHTAYHEQIRKDVNPLVLYVCARFPTADPLLTQFFHSKSIVGTPTAVTNFSHYNKIDHLIEKARVEPDPRKQKEVWGEAQKKIIEDAVALPLCITKFVFARKTYVDLGYEMRSTLTLVTPIKETTDIRK
jgi:peptide/nickel transport system substrate-binding protein